LKFEYGFYWSLTTVYSWSFYHVATMRVKAVLEEQQQHVKYDYTVNLAGTRDRYEYDTESY